jgi:predicted phage-related endonuclease
MLPEGVVSNRTPGGKGRKDILGGTDIPHIVSLTEPETYKYQCIRRLWYEKNGVEPDFVFLQTGPMVRGKLMEKIVAEIFQAESGCRFVRTRPKADELWPGQPRPNWMWPRPDRVFTLPDEEILRILECKTMSRHKFFDMLENGLPFAYKLQPQYYLGATGLEFGTIATMWADGVDYIAEDIERDEETIRMIYEIGEWFMNDVVNQPEPPNRLPLTEDRCGGCPFRLKCLGRGYFEEHVLHEVALDEDERLYNMLSELEVLKARQKEVKDERAALQDEIQAYLEEHYDGEPEKIHCREIDVSWKRSYGSRMDKKAVMSEDRKAAQLIQKHTKVYPKRTLKTKVTKKSEEGWEARQR